MSYDIMVTKLRKKFILEKQFMQQQKTTGMTITYYKLTTIKIYGDTTFIKIRRDTNNI